MGQQRGALLRASQDVCTGRGLAWCLEGGLCSQTTWVQILAIPASGYVS